MLILGLNAFHADSAACLIRDGALIAAAEEERFCRIKHWAGFPAAAINYCLNEAGAGLDDVDAVALNQDNFAQFGARLAYLISNRPGLSALGERARNRFHRGSAAALLRRQFPTAARMPRFLRVEHHLAHLASAFLVSPFDEAVVVSVDGFGDFASAAWGVGRGATIATEGRVLFPHSLGVFYQAITQYLGFPHYGDEYKVMGLAPYGAPSRLADMREIVRLQPDGGFCLDLRYFRHHRERIAFEGIVGRPEFADLFTPALEALLGPRRGPEQALEQRHFDIARSAQAMYEEAFFHLLNLLHARYKLANLALAGGCAMNSAANGKVRRMTPFKALYVQPAAGDAGGAIGAALAASNTAGGRRSPTMSHAYWGPQFDPRYVARLLEREGARIADLGCAVARIASEAELCAAIAREIADGKVIGWFQGRMEWGPRALGARSILCDPRRSDMKAVLNAKIKKRESFRPFAPSVLREAMADWFEEDGDTPFMAEVLQIRAHKRALVPAVTHVDGSGRPQSVDKASNPRFHGLISAFYALTGTPMLLNTSFNENEPIVCKPEEALDCFLRTEMDALALGDFVVRRAALARSPRDAAAFATAETVLQPNG